MSIMWEGPPVRCDLCGLPLTDSIHVVGVCPNSLVVITPPPKDPWREGARAVILALSKESARWQHIAWLAISIGSIGWSWAVWQAVSR